MLAFFIIILTCIILTILYILSLNGRKNMLELNNLLKYDYAHRGLHDKNNPENSLGAFLSAIDNNYGAELDVHLLKDGNLAVIHDSNLSRTTGTNKTIEELTIDELTKYNLEETKFTIPSLDDVLKIFEGKTPLIIELKSANGNHAALCQAVCNKLDKYNVKYCIESFDPRCIIWLKKHRPEIIRGQLSQNFFKNPSGLSLVLNIILSSLVLNFISKPDFVAYNFKHRSSLPNKICTKLWKITEFSWTIDNVQDYDICKKEGLTPIFEKFNP